MDEKTVKHLDQNTILHILTNTQITKNTYINLLSECRNRNYNDFYDNLNNDFETDVYNVKDFIDELALVTQICYKHNGSNMLYLHGFVLYSALDNYIKNNKNIDFFNIIETGTARGFSALCMAKALYDNNVNGKVYTIDILPHNEKKYWNCILDIDGKHTRKELLQEWDFLIDKYIVFKTGDSKIILPELISNLDRVHFSFLDAHHDYDYLTFELNKVLQKQSKNDIIICDDYTFYYDNKMQYPGIQKAIDEFSNRNHYFRKIYFGDDGKKRRGYVYFKKND